jgi:EpsI family protein
VDHLIYGWAFFGVVILVMLFIGARWADPVEPEPAASGAPIATTTNVGSRSFWWTATAAVLVLIAPQLVLRGLQSSVNSVQPVMISMAETAPWQAQPQHGSAWVPAFLNPSANAKFSFRHAGGPVVDLDISYYRQQSRDRKLVSSSNVLVTSGDERWAQVEDGRYSASSGSQPLVLQTATLRDRSAGLTSSGQRLRVWRFYWVGNTFTASDVQAKLRGALHLLQGNGDDAAIVVLSTVLDEQLPEQDRIANADQVLATFFETQGAPLQTALQSIQRGH